MLSPPGQVLALPCESPTNGNDERRGDYLAHGDLSPLAAFISRHRLLSEGPTNEPQNRHADVSRASWSRHRYSKSTGALASKIVNDAGNNDTFGGDTSWYDSNFPARSTFQSVDPGFKSGRLGFIDDYSDSDTGRSESGLDQACNAPLSEWHSSRPSANPSFSSQAATAQRQIKANIRDVSYPAFKDLRQSNLNCSVGKREKTIQLAIEPHSPSGQVEELSSSDKSNNTDRYIYNFSRPLSDQLADVHFDMLAKRVPSSPADISVHRQARPDGAEKLVQDVITESELSVTKIREKRNDNYGAVRPIPVGSLSGDVAAGFSLNTILAVPRSASNPASPTRPSAGPSGLIAQARAPSRSPRRSNSAAPDLPASVGFMSTSDVFDPSADLPELRFASTITPEQHAALGIRFHESGELQYSSYHLRKAAHGSDVTGMILYGLALRHGWGVKVNTREAFIWLNKAAGVAADKASVVGPDTERGRNLCDQLTKESKAQLGLAMYELGVSYLNSWGVGKDEPMAMTCFDIGAQLGDPDAMSELASLWCRNGPGRKKDLHKAAALYREAADRGVSAVGNSWIYKEKYTQPKDEKACGSNRECPDGAAVGQKKSLFSSRKKFYQ